MLVVVSLLLSGLLGSYLSYQYERTSELRIFISQYQMVAVQLADSALLNLRNKLHAMQMHSALASDLCPDSDSWPNCAIEPYSSYVRMMAPLQTLARSEAIGMTSVVRRHERASFEEWSYKRFENDPIFPPGTGLHPQYGRTISKWNITAMNHSMEKIWENNISTESDDDFAAVVTHALPLEHQLRFMMVDQNSWPSRKLMIKDLISCTKKKVNKLKADEDSQSNGVASSARSSDLLYHELIIANTSQCHSYADVMYIYYDGALRPATIITYPVHPRKHPHEIKGYIGLLFYWHEALSQSAIQYIRTIGSVGAGVDCVLAAGAQKFTFTIVEGKATFKGVGDLHDEQFDFYKYSVNLTTARYGPQYTMTIYPTNELEAAWITGTPTFVAAVIFAIVFILSLMYIIFRENMRKAHEEQELERKTKRDFVRFVSHEIRTPLNTVHMGMSLLLDECAQTLLLLTSCGLNEIHLQQLLLQEEGEPLQQQQEDQALSYEAEVHTGQNAIERIISRSKSRSRSTSSFQRSVGGDYNLQAQQRDVSEQNLFTIALLQRRIEEWVGMISDVQVSADTAVQVLNDLINYDKIQFGMLQLEVEITPALKLVEAAVHPFLIQAKQKGLSLTTVLQLVPTIEGLVPCSDNSIDHSAAVENDSNVIRHSQREAAESLTILGDPMKLQQVIRNVVSNALKFTPPGGSITVTVTWQPDGLSTFRSDVLESPTHPLMKSISKSLTVASSPFKHNGSVVVTVRDTGAGISQENQDRLFGEGVQFNASQLQAGKGSGLGLWISKAIVDMHGGKISASSSVENEGCEFRVELPLVIASNGGRSDNRSNSHNNHPAFSVDTTSPPTLTTISSTSTAIANTKAAEDILHKRMHSNAGTDTAGENGAVKKRKIRRVLVVDDVASNRKVLLRILRNDGYNCDEAEDGQQCIDIMLRPVISATLPTIPVATVPTDHITAADNDTPVNSFTTANDVSGICRTELEPSIDTHISSFLANGARESPFDLILMDHQMPVMDGPAAAQRLRQLGFGHIPIVGVTGNVLPEDKKLFLNCGAVQVLHKPLSISKIRELIAELETSDTVH